MPTDFLAPQEAATLGYSLIPLVRELPGDLHTPLSTYIKLSASGPRHFLFESVQGGERWGRYSIIGLPCREEIRVHGKTISRFRDGHKITEAIIDDPLKRIEEIVSAEKVPVLPNMPRLTGGWVGYFGYDTIRYIEPKLGDCKAPDPLRVPDIYLMRADELVVFDNLSGSQTIIVHANPASAEDLAQAKQRLDEIEAAIRAPLADPPVEPSHPLNEDDFVSGMSQEGYEAGVERIREYIRAGDAMQVVLSQRLSIEFNATSLDLYRALRRLNPSPYLYFIDTGDFQVVGSSPEILVRNEGGRVTLRPIAGTRPRGQTEAEDKALEQELLADPKECAEHLMLIDLGRNDVGRVAKVGTVEVTEQMAIERYSHVMHIVSNVHGELKDGMTAMDVLRATFPAGTLTGAPKIRAMEILDELEPVKRGIYSGAVGYISWHGAMDTAIAIRTGLVKDGQLHVQAGAGIVADSDPTKEWEETMNKARAVLRAASIASGNSQQGASS